MSLEAGAREGTRQTITYSFVTVEFLWNDTLYLTKTCCNVLDVTIRLTIPCVNRHTPVMALTPFVVATFYRFSTSMRKKTILHTSACRIVHGGIVVVIKETMRKEMEK